VGPTSKERGREGRGGQGKEGVEERRGKEGEGRERPAFPHRRGGNPIQQ